MKPPNPTERKILEAAIRFIEKNGPDRLTIRSIAEEAGVNVAAINYYFRSKDALIEKTVRLSLDHAFEDWERALENPDRNPRGRIEAFLREFLEGALLYPGVTKAYLFHPLMKSRCQKHFAGRFNRFLKKLLSQAEEAEPTARRDELVLTITQAVGTLFFAGLMPDFFEGFSGKSLGDRPFRKAFVDHLMKKFF